VCIDKYMYVYIYIHIYVCKYKNTEVYIYVSRGTRAGDKRGAGGQEQRGRARAPHGAQGLGLSVSD